MTTWLALAQTATASPPASGSETARPPDVVLISIDTTRADFLTFLDSETAPHLSRFARQGTIFTQATSGASWTLPAHVQMFTGMAPPYHGSEIDLVRIDPRLPVLAERLDEAGYHTIGVYSNSYLWGNYGFDRGFDFYHSAMLAENVRGPEIRFARRGREAVERLQKLTQRGVISAPQVMPIARRALERVSERQPVFLFAHYMDPHSDFIPPPPFDTRFDPGYTGSITGRHYATNPKIIDYAKTPKRQIGDRDLEHIKALYRGEIAAVDEAIGELFALLDRHGRLDDALVIVTSDHGEAFFEHGQPGHRDSIHDEVLRIPLLIVPPRNRRIGIQATSPSPANLSDIVPTVLDYAGLETPPTVTGISLRPAIEGQTFEGREALFSSYRAKPDSNGQLVHSQVYGLRAPDHKIIRRTVISRGQLLRQNELYWDLARDPDARNPISDRSRPEVQRAIARLDARLAEVEAHWQAYPRTSRAQRAVDLDGWMDELKMLGYIVPDEARGADFRLKPWGLAPLPRGSEPDAAVTPAQDAETRAAPPG